MFTKDKEMEHIWKNQNLSLEILKFLQPEELARFSSVSKRFQDLTGKNLLWDVFIGHVYLPTYHHQTEQFHREHVGTIDLSLTVIDFGFLSIKRAGKEDWEGVSKRIYRFIFVDAKAERLKDIEWAGKNIQAIREQKNLQNMSQLPSQHIETPQQNMQAPNKAREKDQWCKVVKEQENDKLRSNIEKMTVISLLALILFAVKKWRYRKQTVKLDNLKRVTNSTQPLQPFAV